jgi:hypothetical protein
MTSSAVALQMKWEYQSLTRVSEAAMIEALNQAGQDSWELVSASHYRDMAGMMAWTAILKRPTAGEPAKPVRREAPAAPVATPPPAKPAPAPPPPEAVEEDTEFEVDVPAVRPSRPSAASKASKLAPAKPRVEISDDFDFELAETASASRQPTRQTKAKPKPAAAEEDFDFELGETFPAKLQPAKPAPPKPKAEGEDETDFDIG